ncbi:MAG TPA: VWA domain-containing protein [Blastocatellia bacterium]|nr:VWA domain-containing protein [Blastocatellia bacterium]
MVRAKVFARSLSFFIIAALALAGIVEGQSGRRLPGTRPKQQDDTIRLRAEEVLLNVTVIDPFGRQATDLHKDEFIIAEDNERQDMASFAVSSVPVNVVMMLDASGSVVGEIASLRDAAMKFVEQLGPEDKVSVTEFHTDVELIQDWTSNAEELKHAISWRFKPGMVRTKEGRSAYGTTSLFDAIYLTAEEQLSKVEGRKAIIILTDGDDTSSKVTYEQALAAVIRSGAVVYVVSKARAIMAIAGKFYRARFERAELLMKELATRTGGSIFSPLKDDEMKEVYTRVARELKNQYTITYIPKNDKRDGGLRRISVFLTRSGYSARTRNSYYAPGNK